MKEKKKKREKKEGNGTLRCNNDLSRRRACNFRTFACTSVFGFAAFSRQQLIGERKVRGNLKNFFFCLPSDFNRFSHLDSECITRLGITVELS